MKRRSLHSRISFFARRHKTLVKITWATAWLGLLYAAWEVYAPEVAEIFSLEVLMTRILVMLIIISFSLIVEYS